MADRSIARRYATAFIDLAVEHNAIDRLLGELERLERIARADGDQLLRALSNPVFLVEERRAVLTSAMDRSGIGGLTRNLALLLLDKGRFSALPDVLAIYRELADEKARRARVQVETADALTPQLESEVRAAMEKVTGKHVILEVTVNPDLIGGLVATVGGKVYDASVKSRLSLLRQTLRRASFGSHAVAEA